MLKIIITADQIWNLNPNHKSPSKTMVSFFYLLINSRSCWFLVCCRRDGNVPMYNIAIPQFTIRFNFSSTLPVVNAFYTNIIIMSTFMTVG